LLPLLALAFASSGLVAQLPSLPEIEPTPLELAVPFGCGRAYPVSQGHETGSHLLNDTWAWDFRMPSGVPITAALDGTVRLARGDSTRGGCDPSFAPDANYVVIAHDNGLETQYLHLETVAVRPGDKVKAGDILGYSGKTGWACGSHLHFKLARSDGAGWNNPSIHARIKGYGDPALETIVEATACVAATNAIATKPTGEAGSGSASSASASPSPSVPGPSPTAATIVREVLENTNRAGMPPASPSGKAPVSSVDPPARSVQPANTSPGAGTGATN